MKILIYLICFILISSCVPVSPLKSNVQVLTPIEKTVEPKGEVYWWEEHTVYFKITLQSDSRFQFIKDSYSDCTGSRWCESSGIYKLKGDSILLNFEKATGGREAGNYIEAFSDREIIASFSECKINLLTIELKNKSCD